MLDWTGTPDPMAREILRQCELQLQALLQIGIAADQRATTLCNVFGAGAIALFAAAMAVFASSSPNIALVAGGCVGAGLLGLAAVLAGMVAMPEDFHPVGSRAKLWYGVRMCDLATVMAGEAENYDERIEYNRRVLLRSAQRIKSATCVAGASPLLGGFIFLLLRG